MLGRPGVDISNQRPFQEHTSGQKAKHWAGPLAQQIRSDQGSLDKPKNVSLRQGAGDQQSSGRWGMGKALSPIPQFGPNIGPKQHFFQNQYVNVKISAFNGYGWGTNPPPQLPGGKAAVGP